MKKFKEQNAIVVDSPIDSTVDSTVASTSNSTVKTGSNVETANQPQQLSSDSNAANSEPMPDPAPTDPIEPVDPLQVTAEDNDDMSQPQQQQPQQMQQSMPIVDVIKANWTQQIGAAKIAWGKLTEDELLKTEGHAQKLSGLVQERYAIKRDEAEKQVKKFIEQCGGEKK